MISGRRKNHPIKFPNIFCQIACKRFFTALIIIKKHPGWGNSNIIWSSSFSFDWPAIIRSRKWPQKRSLKIHFKFLIIGIWRNSGLILSQFYLFLILPVSSSGLSFWPVMSSQMNSHCFNYQPSLVFNGRPRSRSIGGFVKDALYWWPKNSFLVRV